MDQLKIYAERWDELKPLITVAVDDWDAAMIDFDQALNASLDLRPVPYLLAAELVRLERQKRGIALWPLGKGYDITRRDGAATVHLDKHGVWSPLARGEWGIYPYHEANVIGLIEGCR